MKRTPLRRRSPMSRRRARATRYARRERDLGYMRFVKALLCSVEEEWPDSDAHPTLCMGPVEADHAGERGLGQKAPDRTCIPLCTGHHRERTDHTGTFKHVSREHERRWRARAIARTQAVYAERHETATDQERTSS